MGVQPSKSIVATPVWLVKADPATTWAWVCLSTRISQDQF